MLMAALKKNHLARNVPWNTDAFKKLTDIITKTVLQGFVLITLEDKGVKLIDPDIVGTTAKFRQQVFVPCLKAKVGQRSFFRQSLQAFMASEPSLRELKRRVEALVANSTQVTQEKSNCVPIRAEVNTRPVNLDKSPGYNSIQIVKKLEKWKRQFIQELVRFEVSPLGEGWVFKSGSLYIYISQLWTERFSTKNLIIILHMIGLFLITISICFYCGTRRFCRENRDVWLRPICLVAHCLCDRTNQGQPSPPPTHEARRDDYLPPGQYQLQQRHSQSAISPHGAQTNSIEMQDMFAPTRPQRRAITYEPRPYNENVNEYSALTVA